MARPFRGRATAAAATQPAGRHEAFRLDSSGAPAFTAIIRLTPDLVDEIRRAEEAGGGARIKFNPSIHNSSENVIDVSGKEFKFNWTSERGELCDIYEERQSGEDGNGLLLECGSAWRKVNVQRILDESAKNLVKMRSEEAERLSKSRKSIVLDPANPSVKSQAKSLVAAAVEGNPRRMHWKQKNEFLRKIKAAVIIPTKSVTKVKLSNNIPKGNISSSPAPSPEQPGASNPSFPVGSDANNEVITPFDSNKGGNSKYEKSAAKMCNKGINRRASSHATNVDDNTNEVRTYLISVLSKNTKGMGLKALEKAAADAFPNASKKIETIVKSIANYQRPEGYVLKPGLEASGTLALPCTQASVSTMIQGDSTLPIHSAAPHTPTATIPNAPNTQPTSPLAISASEISSSACNPDGSLETKKSHTDTGKHGHSRGSSAHVRKKLKYDAASTQVDESAGNDDAIIVTANTDTLKPINKAQSSAEGTKTK